MASAFKPASSAGHDAAIAVVAAGAAVCANSGWHKTTDAMNEALLEAGCNDDYEYQMHKTALERALIQAKL